LAKAAVCVAQALLIIKSGMAWCRSVTILETPMNWQTPAYCEIRLGFEVTAYVYVR
jgi:pyrroloquinoline quinone biosynthesis protein A